MLTHLSEQASTLEDCEDDEKDYDEDEQGEGVGVVQVDLRDMSYPFR